MQCIDKSLQSPLRWRQQNHIVCTTKQIGLLEYIWYFNTHSQTRYTVLVLLEYRPIAELPIRCLDFRVTRVRGLFQWCIAKNRGGYTPFLPQN
jgi:hypothetical protein